MSLLESLLDLPFEVLTTHLNDGEKLPQRAAYRNAHAYLGAPYGIYQTRDGWIAIAMGCNQQLGELLGCGDLTKFDTADSFTKRSEIKQVLANHLATRTTDAWLAILEPADFWCSDVFNYGELMQHAGYEAADMELTVRRTNGTTIKTTRCPIRIDGQQLRSQRAAPTLGDANE